MKHSSRFRNIPFRISKKVKVIIIIIFVLMAIPVGSYYAIGPRYITSSGLTTDLTIYYMGDEYKCISAYPGAVDTGRKIGYLNVFEDAFKVKGQDDLIYVRSWQARYLYEKAE